MPLPRQRATTRHTPRGLPPLPPAKGLSKGPPVHLYLSQDPSLEINSSLTPAEELGGESDSAQDENY